MNERIRYVNKIAAFGGSAAQKNAAATVIDGKRAAGVWNSGGGTEQLTNQHGFILRLHAGERSSEFGFDTEKATAEISVQYALSHKQLFCYADGILSRGKVFCGAERGADRAAIAENLWDGFKGSHRLCAEDTRIPCSEAGVGRCEKDEFRAVREAALRQCLNDSISHTLSAGIRVGAERIEIGGASAAE